jgi:hypothetical protein
MNSIRKIGLKYCGGCSQRYDRVKQVRRIKEELGGTIEFVPPHEPGTDFILAVMGCDTACANLHSLEGKQIRLITSEKDSGALIKELKGEN